jgi:hydrogenase maturation protease
MQELRVIGLGQPYAGDDAAGYAVVQRLRATGFTNAGQCSATVHHIDDPTALIELLNDVEQVIVVDAVVCEPPGHVLELDRAELRPPASLSSHGVNVASAIELARVVLPNPCTNVRLVGITIARPPTHTATLSEPVAAAVAQVVAMIERSSARGENGDMRATS